MAYREYYFEREPFLPSLEGELRGRDTEWGSIKDFLEESFSGNRTRALLILADYGYGKTFILNKIRENVSNPDSSIVGSGKTITSQIVLAETEPASSISYEYITKVMYGVGMKRLKRIAGKIPARSFDNYSKNFQAVIKGIKHGKQEAFGWLTGATLSANERSNIGVMRKFHPSESLIILLDFLRAMKEADYDNLLVLIDEFEYAVNVYSEAKLTQFFHTFKNIYDRFVSEGGSEVFAKHIQIIAATPRGWDVVTDLEARLRRTKGGGGITPWLERMRFERNKVVLGPLSEEASKQILVDRIRKERMKFPEVDYETFPFIHPSFFDEIIRVSKGNTRTLLDYSEIVLEEAARKDLREIDGQKVLEILAEFDLVSK